MASLFRRSSITHHATSAVASAAGAHRAFSPAMGGGIRPDLTNTEIDKLLLQKSAFNKVSTPKSPNCFLLPRESPRWFQIYLYCAPALLSISIKHFGEGDGRGTLVESRSITFHHSHTPWPVFTLLFSRSFSMPEHVCFRISKSAF